MKLERLHRAVSHADRAQLAVDAGLLEAAQQQLSRALELDPGSVDARLLQAHIAMQRENPVDARAAVDAIDLYHPEQWYDLKWALVRAQVLLRCGDTDMALRSLQQHGGQGLADERADRMLAAIHIGRGDSAAAIDHLSRVVRADRSDRVPRRVLAELLAEREPEEAAELLSQDEAARSDAVLQLRIARLLRAAGRLRECEDIYCQLLQMHGDDVDLWVEAGQLSADLGAMDHAVMRLEHALDGAGWRDAGALAALAKVHMRTGQVKRAAVCWQKLARMAPAHGEAWAGTLVCALTEAGHRLARRAARVLGVHTSRRERRSVLAHMWQQATMGNQLQRIAGGAIHGRSSRQSPLNRLLARAEHTLTAHGQAYPQRADTHYHLAMCQKAMGQRARSIQSLHKALEINPNYKRAAALHQAQHLRRAA